MPPRGTKRKSMQSIASEKGDAPSITTTVRTTGQKVATKTSNAEDSPSNRRKLGLTIAQKQAMIDNLQLEVTERARKLRAQYNLQAQGLRTRIEIRVNRVPMALRKLKMDDLLQKYSIDQQKPIALKQSVASAARSCAPPPVFEKDFNHVQSAVSRADLSPRATHTVVNRPLKRLSGQVTGGDKENQNTHLGNPNKRQRGGNNPSTTHSRQPTQILSPASSNSRMNPREGIAQAPPSPAKSSIARPMSPTKQSTATELLSNMVEKARATRAAATKKPTTSSTSNLAAGGGTTSSRARSKGMTAASSRNTKRISGISESSEASTSTVVRKGGRPAGGTTASGARKATGAAAVVSTKKTMMSSIKKGMASAGTRKTPATKVTATTTALATPRSGRVLRRRD